MKHLVLMLLPTIFIGFYLYVLFIFPFAIKHFFLLIKLTQPSKWFLSKLSSRSSIPLVQSRPATSWSCFEPSTGMFFIQRFIQPKDLLVLSRWISRISPLSESSLSCFFFEFLVGTFHTKKKIQTKVLSLLAKRCSVISAPFGTSIVWLFAELLKGIATDLVVCVSMLFGVGKVFSEVTAFFGMKLIQSKMASFSIAADLELSFRCFCPASLVFMDWVSVLFSFLYYSVARNNDSKPWCHSSTTTSSLYPLWITSEVVDVNRFVNPKRRGPIQDIKYFFFHFWKESESWWTEEFDYSSEVFPSSTPLIS